MHYDSNAPDIEMQGIKLRTTSLNSNDNDKLIIVSKYLEKFIPVLCHRCCKQHLHIVMSDTVEQHFLNIPARLREKKIKMSSL